MSITGGIIAGVGLAGSIGGAAISSNAAGNAASEQSSAAEQAAQLQYQASQNALGFQEGVYGQDQANEAPFLASGEAGQANLDYLLGITPPTTQGAASGTPGAYTGAGVGQGGTATNPATTGAAGTGAPGTTGTTNLSSMVNPSLGNFGSLLQSYPGGPFVAPTAAQANASPGEQAQLQLGEQAMQQSAAAQGSLLTGGTEEALNGYAQNLASTNYQNVYNDAYNTYASGYNQYQNQQTNTYNRLAGLAGGGQTTANTLGTLGTSAASGVTSNLNSTASAIGQDTQNAAAANASGIVGSANAYSGALTGTASNLSNLALLSSLGGTTSSNSPAYYPGAQANPYTNQVDQENEMTSLGASYG